MGFEWEFRLFEVDYWFAGATVEGLGIGLELFDAPNSLR